MKYKGYRAIVAFDEHDQVLHGHVLNIRDIICFEADSVHQINQAFREAVDDYLDQCVEPGVTPTSLKDTLASAPLENLDIDRPRDLGRENEI